VTGGYAAAGGSSAESLAYWRFFSCSGLQLSDLLTHFILAPHEEFGGLLNEIAASNVVLEFEHTGTPSN
jgi:hypothetical protein